MASSDGNDYHHGTQQQQRQDLFSTQPNPSSKNHTPNIMAENPSLGEGSLTNFVGRSKKELYDIMCNVKALIDQDEAHMKQVFIQNPELTKALFQAQIMLGMVRPPQEDIQTITSRLLQQENVKATRPLLGQSGLHDQTGAAKASTSAGKQQQNPPPMMQTSSYPTTTTTMDVQSSQFLPSQALQSVQPKAHVHTEATPQPLQVVNVPTPILPYSASLPPPPLQRPMASTYSPLDPTSGISRRPLQPPLPPKPIPYSMFAFSSQANSQMGQNAGLQRSVSPQLHHPQPSFHPVGRPPISSGLPFPPEQPISVQPPPQSLYHQARGSHLGREFNSPAGSSSMQHERGPVQMPSFPRNAVPTQLPPGRPPFPTGQASYSYHPPPPAPLPMSPELQRSLIQQVLALTPQEISRLSPEQRNQVLYLQRMLRQ